MARIIVLDGNQEFRELAEVLKDQGYAVELIAQSSDAIDQNYLTQPDILVAANRRNNGYDGHEICQAFKHGNPRVRIIMIGRTDTDLPKGMCCFNPCTFTLATVLATIQEMTARI